MVNYKLQRRKFLSFASLLPLFIFNSSLRANDIYSIEKVLEPRYMGNVNAPIKFTEFISFTCSHCADFHINKLPSIKEKYIDTGKIYFTYKDFPLDKFALKASMIARCSGERKFFSFLNVFYKKQKDWTRTKDPFKSLLKIAKVGGLKDEELKVCIGNKSIEDGILKDRLKSSKKFDITATPTIYLDGVKYKGDLTIEALESKIESLLD